MVKAILLAFCLLFSLTLTVKSVSAQGRFFASPTPTPSPSPSPELEATLTPQVSPGSDVTQPEETPETQEFLQRFEKRQVSELKFYNFMPYYVQKAVLAGVPANTVILILLLPLLATVVAFARQIIGVPTLEMLVPIAFSVALVSTGLAAGTILLITILLATAVSRFLLKKVKIMQVPRKSLTIFIVSVFVFVSLYFSAVNGLLSVRQLSIFPILIIILLGEKIISVQLTRTLNETVTIVSVTVLLSLGGYFILIWPELRANLLLYPELVFLLIPINFMIGRYFGLRLSELYRFARLIRNGNR